jgi:deoxyadenosine/deoxycytidine kinase
LVIYLRAKVDTLKTRIQKRNRVYERQISVEYLERLNRLYEDWFEHFSLCPVLTIPADQLDFVANNEHLDFVVEKIMERLRGKEVVVFNKDK